MFLLTTKNEKKEKKKKLFVVILFAVEFILLFFAFIFNQVYFLEETLDPCHDMLLLFIIVYNSRNPNSVALLGFT